MMCSKKALVGTVRCRWAQIVVLTRVLIRVAAGRRWALLSAAGHCWAPLGAAGRICANFAT